MNSTMRKLVAILLAALVACTLVPTLAFAADKTLAKQNFSMKTSVISKKSATVKRGTYKLVLKSNEGYVKFKAAKTKTYTFTFSSLKGSHVYSGFVSIQKQSTKQSKYSPAIKVATQGGKTNTLWLAANGYASKSGKLLYRNLPSRTAKLKLKKGQTVYFHIYTTGKSQRSLNLKVQ